MTGGGGPTCPTCWQPRLPVLTVGSRWRRRAFCRLTPSWAPGRGSTTWTTSSARGTTTSPPQLFPSRTSQWTISPRCPPFPPCRLPWRPCPTTLSAGQYYSTDFITQRNLYVELLMMTISILLIFISPTKKLRRSFIWMSAGMSVESEAVIYL